MRALLLLVFAAPAAAQSISGDVGGVTDYRFRGVSRSAREPAAQASLDLTSSNGLYGSVFASSVDERGSHAELDATLGYTHRLGPLNASAGATSYVFPGGRGAVAELQSSLSYAIATATATVGADYAPDQGGLPRANRYVYANIEIGVPATPLTLMAHVGSERGGMVALDTGRPAKLDWRLGGELRRGRVAVTLSYVATDLPNAVRAARPAVLAGVRWQF